MCVSFDIFCNYYSVSILIGGPVVGVNWVLGGGLIYIFYSVVGCWGFPIGVLRFLSCWVGAVLGEII